MNSKLKTFDDLLMEKALIESKNKGLLFIDEGSFIPKPKKYLEVTIGSFMWAIEQMKDLKCVRRKGWQPSQSICVLTGTEQIYNEDGKLPHLSLLDIESNDWEVYGINYLSKETRSDT